VATDRQTDTANQKTDHDWKRMCTIYFVLWYHLLDFSLRENAT